MSTDPWRSETHEYAVVDWRLARYLCITWIDDNHRRAVVARVLDVEQRDGRPVITAQDLCGRRRLIFDPDHRELRKRVDGEEIRIGECDGCEAPREEVLDEEHQDVDGYDPEQDVQSGLTAWGVRL